MRHRRLIPCAVPLLLVGAIWACSSDGPASPTTGTLAIEMTDKPTELLESINVYIIGLTVKPEERPIERIANEVGLVDLLSLQNATQLLAIASVEPGSYNHIRVELDEDRSNVVEKGSGEEKPLKIASEEVKVNGGFEVVRGDRTTIVLDFDAEQSIRLQGNGQWLLVPVILQAEVRQDQ